LRLRPATCCSFGSFLSRRHGRSSPTLDPAATVSGASLRKQTPPITVGYGKLLKRTVELEGERRRSARPSSGKALNCRSLKMCISQNA
jgi:hypothetical protein